MSIESGDPGVVTLRAVVPLPPCDPSSGPPRVAIVCADRGVPLRAPAGGGVHLRGIAEGFLERGATVGVFAARLTGPSAQPVVLLSPSISVQHLPRGRLPGVLRKRSPRMDRQTDARAASRAAGDLVAAFRPNVVYERYALFADAGRRARKRLPGIAWVLEVNAPRSWESALFEGLPLGRREIEQESAVLRAADRVVVVSAALRDWVVSRGVRSDRVRVLANGAALPSLARSSLRAGPGPFRLGYAGTFKPWHRMVESIPALRALTVSMSPRSVVLDLRGDGPTRGTLLEALAASQIPGLSVEASGWTPPHVLSEARREWDAAWVPSGGPWPPPGAAAISDVFGEPCPGRWFDPLKGAEARAAALPIWSGEEGLGPQASTLGVASWAAVSAAAVSDLPQWKDRTPLGGSDPRTAPVGGPGGAPR